jgi:aromatic-L-amino-acid/L-tryptophan decarboxylase
MTEQLTTDHLSLGATGPGATGAPEESLLLRTRRAPVDLSPDEFRRIGHLLVDAAAELLNSIPERPVTPGLTPSIVRTALGDDGLPAAGTDPAELMRRATDLFARYSTFNGHPRFFGYITAGPAPLGVLSELLAATVNANCGAWSLSPLATEIERRTVRWIAELLGYPTNAGGLFVSGGNMANIVAVWAARAARAGWNVRERGITPPEGRGDLVLYASTETHTWIQKAAELCGLGTRAVRWIPVDSEHRMRVEALRERIRADRVAGFTPLLVVGTAGTVSTGAIDPLQDIAEVCKDEDLWFHVDGAYGAPAAMLPEATDDLKALALGDSLAVDPHKWLYAPVEAGCVLVRDAAALHDAFHYRPPYYHFHGDPDDAPTNFHEWGPQNSRGNRALKVWLTLQQVGRAGYQQMIRDDIALARHLDRCVRVFADLEPGTCRLSVATFRFVPDDLRLPAPWRLDDSAGPTSDAAERDAYVDRLNTTILSTLQDEGLAYVSNAVMSGRFFLRACIVNFRTRADDVQAVPELAVRIGRALDRRQRGTLSPYARYAGDPPHALERLTQRWWDDRLARLARSQRAMLELAMAHSSSPVFSRAAAEGTDVVSLLAALAAGDHRAAHRLHTFATGPDGHAEADALSAPPSLAAALDQLRRAQSALAEAMAGITAEDRLVDRRIIQEIEERALEYERQAARLR